MVQLASPDNSKLLVIKLGGSVITDKSTEFSVNRDTLRRLAKELSAVDKPFIVIHGGGSFGHPLASDFKIDSGYMEKRQLMGFSLIHRAMETLNSEVVDAFQLAGQPVVSVQPLACAIVEGGRIKSMDLRGLSQILKMEMIPVLFGDVVSDLERGMSILSGDQLSVFLAEKLGADRVLVGVDTDGVYSEDPRRSVEAKLLPVITPENWEEISLSEPVRPPDVTGGMKQKVEELLRLTKMKIEAQIVNASKPGILKRAIEGDKSLGTRILGE